MIVLLALLNVSIVFWNLENFFAPDPESEKHWTSSRFYSKCEGIAKTVMLIADSEGSLPDALCFAEVGDSSVMARLLRYTILYKAGYRIIHYESPDHRGIDCAMMYRTGSLKKLYSEPCHLYDSLGNVMHTRDILLAKFVTSAEDTLAVLVNHHPSKVGGGSSSGRSIAMDTMIAICDSLSCPTVSVGDFNDGSLFHGEGTYKYDGRWEKLDGCFHFRVRDIREKVFSHPYLTVPDKAHGGFKPKRTYVGPRYQGGISDHLPIVITVDF